MRPVFIDCFGCKRQFVTTNPTQWYSWRNGKRCFCTRLCQKESGQTLRDRFLAHAVEQPNGCIHCDFGLNTHGYPVMSVDGRLRLVSHIAWFLHYGWWPPKGMDLDHTCHDPQVCRIWKECMHRRCVNWQCLKLVTHKENTSHERSNAGRMGSAFQKAKTHCPAGHEYTEENTYVWGNNYRKCRTCMRINDMNYKQIKRARVSALRVA